MMKSNKFAMWSISLISVSNMKTWEESISGSNFSLNLTQKSRRILLEFLDGLRLPDIDQKRFLNGILSFLSKLPNSGNSKWRHLITRLYPSPILDGAALELEIFIFTAEKDLEVLELSIIGSIQSSQNKISTLTVIAPGSLEPEVHKILQRVPEDVSLKFLSDEELLARFALEKFHFIRPNIKMEILKVLATITSECEAVLLIDGDTVLLKARVWITEEKQIALVAQEYTPAHINFDKKYLNLKRLSGLGFVTHHQIIRRAHLDELIAEKGELFNFVSYFNAAASEFYLHSGKEFPSEWQLFGDFLLSRHPKNAVLSSFKNLGMSRRSISYFLKGSFGSASTEIARMKAIAPDLASVSFHGYKD